MASFHTEGSQEASSTQSPAFPPPALAYMLRAAAAAAAQVRRGGTLLSSKATTGRRGPWQGNNVVEKTTGVENRHDHSQVCL